MPAEVVLIAILSIVAGTGLAGLLILQVAQVFKARRSSAESAGSVTMSELEESMRRVVSGEMAALGTRLDRVESELGLSEPNTPLLDIPDESEYGKIEARADDRGSRSPA